MTLGKRVEERFVMAKPADPTIDYDYLHVALDGRKRLANVADVETFCRHEVFLAGQRFHEQNKTEYKMPVMTQFAVLLMWIGGIAFAFGYFESPLCGLGAAVALTGIITAAVNA